MTMPPTHQRGAARLALVACAAAALSACSDSLDPPRQREIAVASISVDGDAAPSAAKPRITFFRADGLSVVDSRTATDRCTEQVTVAPPGTEPTVPGISAGSAVAFDLSGASTQLVPTTSTNGTVYAPASNATVAIANGDSAKFRVPGAANGYPALTFSLKTAELLSIQPVVVPPADGTADLPVSWNAGDNNSALALTLTYTTGGGAKREINCFLIDDGSFAIPDDVLDNWRAATTTARAGVATRFRTNNAAPGENAIAFGVSTFQKTVTIQQP